MSKNRHRPKCTCRDCISRRDARPATGPQLVEEARAARAGVPHVGAPTRESAAHGAFAQLPGDVAGRKVYVRCEPALLDKLRMLTRQQREAGRAFCADYVRVWGTGGTRDTLDMSPRGQAHETPSQAEAWASARRRLNAVLNKAGPGAYAVLAQVCAFEEPLGAQSRKRKAYAALFLGLDVCAAVYNVPEYECA